MSSKPAAKQSFSFVDVLRFAAGYWARQPKTLSFILLMLLIAAVLEAYLPTALATFINAIQDHQDKKNILFGLGIFIGTYFAQALLFSLVYLIYNSFETILFKDLVDDVFAHIYRLPESFFANTFTGSIVSKINRARQKIEVFEDQILIRIFTTLIILVGSLFFLMLQFPLLSMALIAYLIVLVIVSIFLVFKISGPAQGAYAKAQDGFSAHAADSLSGIASTKSYAQEKYELSRFFKVTDNLRQKNLRAYHRGNITSFMQRMLLVGMLVILMGGGTWYFLEGQASVASMAYLVFAYSIMQSYIREVAENIKNLLTSSYDLHGVMELVSQKPEVPVETILPPLTIQRGQIIFDKVEFTYPDKSAPIFKNFSLTIQAGERVALVGHSGSGKTSFIRLLQSLYPIQKGHILIDGQDIQTGSRESLRSAMALVPQDPILFHRSLRENIAYAKPSATDAEIQAAARKAHIENFILSLPEQYDTLVGERGIKLSGGERQRIAIARAILADRPILILDEATSSLDSESERAIQDALHTLLQDRTSIMIAHRLSTILDADRILVFEAGEIVEQGTHAELLLKQNGIYAHLFNMQSGGLWGL
jgi:ATP-binding cassette subfamily B protein